MTGSPTRPRSGVQILRFRQSSPSMTGSARRVSNGGKYGGFWPRGAQPKDSPPPPHDPPRGGGVKQIEPTSPGPPGDTLVGSHPPHPPPPPPPPPGPPP